MLFKDPVNIIGKIKLGVSFHERENPMKQVTALRGLGFLGIVFSKLLSARIKNATVHLRHVSVYNHSYVSASNQTIAVKAKMITISKRHNYFKRP